MNTLFLLSPIISLTFFALLLLIVQVSFKSSPFKNSLSFLIALTSLLSTFFLSLLQLALLQQPAYLFSQSLAWNQSNLLLILLISLCAFLIILNSKPFVFSFYSQMSEYYSLVLFSLLGMISLVLSNDLFSFFISFEIMSISFYVLVGISSKNFVSSEASLKYLVLGAFSSAFLLLGLAFIYGSTGLTLFSQILKPTPQQPIQQHFLLLGFLLVVITLLFKIGAFPFHQWLPDVYQGSPMPITALMTTSLKIAALAFLIKIIALFSQIQNPHPIILHLLLFSCLSTMIAGNLLALLQSNINRLIAYSSIANTGYLLIPIIQIASNPSPSLYPQFPSIFLYLFIYSFNLIGLFVSLISCSSQTQPLYTLENLRGLAYRNKIAGLSLAFFLFSLAGIPPTPGFFAKFFLFKLAFQNQFFFLPSIGILSSILSVFYYLKIVSFLYLKEENRYYTPINLKPSTWFSFLFILILTSFISFFPNSFSHYFFSLIMLNK